MRLLLLFKEDNCEGMCHRIAIANNFVVSVCRQFSADVEKFWQ